MLRPFYSGKLKITYMKKFFFLAILLWGGYNTFSQTVLNEVYTEPGSSNEEFIELYNSSVGSQNVNCFTILTYWASGQDKGWYVLDFPDATVGPKGFYVLAASDPFTTQNNPPPGVSPNVNWNDPAFRNGSTGGYLKKWQVNGSSYTDVTANIPANLNDLVENEQFNGPTYTILVFVNGVFTNGFIGGGSSGNLPASVAAMPDLPVDMSGSCTDFTINFSTIGAMEYVNESPGSDNGYARSSDGKCGAWDKTSNALHHTPGVTNGSAAGLNGQLTTSQLLQCNTGPSVSKITYNITGVSGAATEADDFPVEVQLYYDHGTPGQLDAADIYQSSLVDNLISDPAKEFTISQTENVILVYKTKRGCFDKVFPIANGCLPLPVAFKSFSVVRSNSTVNLSWETLFESKNSGFFIEKNIGNNVWKECTFVQSKAINGESNIPLTYFYQDINTHKGITQYRIRQINFDGKATYSEIRSIRGDGQTIKTVVYPNPSTDGDVNILFEEANSVKDIMLIDATGKIVRQWKSVAKNNMQISNLLSGMYILKVSIPETGKSFMQKIIVNR